MSTDNKSHFETARAGACVTLRSLFYFPPWAACAGVIHIPTHTPAYAATARGGFHVPHSAITIQPTRLQSNQASSRGHGPSTVLLGRDDQRLHLAPFSIDLCQFVPRAVSAGVIYTPTHTPAYAVAARGASLSPTH